MPRIFDPLAGKAWKLNACKVRREVEKGYAAPLSELVPKVPKGLAIYVKLPGGPRCSAANYLRVSVLAAKWWSGEKGGRDKWRLGRQKTYRVGKWAPRRAKHRKFVAHGWGRLAEVGAAAVNSDQMRAVEKLEFSRGGA